jgi:F-type H+-transporting ATPase subunit epsilon
MALRVSVITPEGRAFEGEAASVTLEAHDGQVAFLKGHAPFVGALGIGALAVTPQGGAPRRWFLEGGVVQVADDQVSVLAERVVDVAALDAEAARKDLATALALVPTTDVAFAERDRALASARTRLRLAAP